LCQKAERATMIFLHVTNIDIANKNYHNNLFNLQVTGTPVSNFFDAN
jgi:hypothetical protein